MPVWVPLAIAGAVQSVSNIIGNVHARNVAKRNTDKTIAEQKRLAELAYQREKDNIDAMNQYNSPQQQMKRFEEAGLNRNLIYTQGTSGNQSTIAKYQTPNVEYKYQVGFKGDSISPLTDLPLKAEQIKNLITQGKILQAEKTTKEAIAKYANAMQRANTRIKLAQADMIQVERTFKFAELDTFFERKEDGSYDFREGMEQKFIDSITNKWLKPMWDGERTKSQTEMLKKQLELQSGVLPWLQPIISFLKVLAPVL